MVYLDVAKAQQKAVNKMNRRKINRQKRKTNVNKRKAAEIFKQFKIENIPGPGKKDGKESNLKILNGTEAKHKSLNNNVNDAKKSSLKNHNFPGSKNKSFKNKLNEELKIKYILNDNKNDKENEVNINSNSGK